MTLPTLDKFDSNYDEHCHNIAYILRDIYRDVSNQYGWQLDRVARGLTAHEAPSELFERLDAEIGEQTHDRLLQQARTTANAAVEHYLGVTGVSDE